MIKVFTFKGVDYNVASWGKCPFRNYLMCGLKQFLSIPGTRKCVKGNGKLTANCPLPFNKELAAKEANYFYMSLYLGSWKVIHRTGNKYNNPWRWWVGRK